MTFKGVLGLIFTTLGVSMADSEFLIFPFALVIIGAVMMLTASAEEGEE